MAITEMKYISKKNVMVVKVNSLCSPEDKFEINNTNNPKKMVIN